MCARVRARTCLTIHLLFLQQDHPKIKHMINYFFNRQMRNQTRQRGRGYKDPGDKAFLSGTHSRASKSKQLQVQVCKASARTP